MVKLYVRPKGASTFNEGEVMSSDECDHIIARWRDKWTAFYVQGTYESVQA